MPKESAEGGEDMIKASHLALWAALLAPLGAQAQDVTLISREGNISLSGTLQGYDGEFYRIDSDYGPLTVDGEGVICEGPACPDLIAPKAVMRFVGLDEAGMQLLPKLLASFAANRGLSFSQEQQDGLWNAKITEPKADKILAEISFAPMEGQAALAALEAGEAEFFLSFNASKAAHPVALESLIVLKSASNPTPIVSSADLAKALQGASDNWLDLGGPDMPVILHGLAAENDLGQAISKRLGQENRAQILHASTQALAEAVLQDPWALAVAGASQSKSARSLDLTDSCGFAMRPDALSVKAEDYPLAIPLYLNLPPRRLPLMAREFVEFLSTTAADRAISEAGYIGRAVERAPMTRDGQRLMNAIKAARDAASLTELQRLAATMDGADRLSLTFRYERDGSVLTASSLAALEQLANLIAVKQYPTDQILLVGFNDSAARPEDNLAQDLRERLATIAPELKPEDLPEVMNFGAALPIACDQTPLGKHLNRRVEVWLKPKFSH